MEQMFPLTRGEVLYMAQALGQEPARFAAADQADQGFLAFAQAINPLLAQAMPGGRRLRLRIKEGRCCLLGPQGCTLGLEQRPLYCRLYPFFFTSDGRLMVLASQRCLAQEGATSWREVLARLGEEEGRLRGLFQRYQDLVAQHRQAEPLELDFGPGGDHD